MEAAVIESILEGATGCLLPMIFGAVKHQVKKTKKTPVVFDNIGEFWEASNKGILKEGKYFSIEGALSKYCPMLIGPPKAKREVHRAYRRSIPEADYRKNKTTVDAYLAFTAGQMVWRLDLQESPWVYLGLYHSIVRNAIPVFVDKNYYFGTVEKIFSQGPSPHVVEAKIEGRLLDISGSFINEFVKKFHLGSLIRPEIVVAGKQTLGIVVDGHDTKIKYVGKPRYLDGDIWVAVELKGEQFFVSRFLDLADPGDLNQESQALKDDVEEFLPDGKIIFQFDQVDKLMPGYQRIKVDDLINRFTRR